MRHTPIAQDLAEYIRAHGVRADGIAAGVQDGAQYTFIERVSYTGSSAALAAVSVVVSDGRWTVRETIPMYGAVVAVVSSVYVNEVVRPGGTLAITLVGGGNSVVNAYLIARETVDQWCAARNRPIP